MRTLHKIAILTGIFITMVIIIVFLRENEYWMFTSVFMFLVAYIFYWIGNYVGKEEERDIFIKHLERKNG